MQAHSKTPSTAGRTGLPAALALALLCLLPSQAGSQNPSPTPPTVGAARETGQPILDEATLKQEYAGYRASVHGMRIYRVSYIRVPTETLARDLIARIRSGADFAVLAQRHSTHEESSAKAGGLGSHASCRWAKATLEVLDTLKEGQTWPKPLKGTHGWGIYRLDEVTPVEPRSFEGYQQELLSGKFEPECPWVPPVTIAPATPPAPVPDAGRK